MTYYDSPDDRDFFYEDFGPAPVSSSSTPMSCRDRFCGAYDCSTCHGDSAWDYFTPCANCDEPSAEQCTCEEYKRSEE